MDNLLIPFLKFFGGVGAFFQKGSHVYLFAKPKFDNAKKQLLQSIPAKAVFYYSNLFLCSMKKSYQMRTFSSSVHGLSLAGEASRS